MAGRTRDDSARAVRKILISTQAADCAIQGKMAKLDGQWGGDFSNVTHAVADAARRRIDQYAVADLGACEGNLIAWLNAAPRSAPRRRTSEPSLLKLRLREGAGRRRPR